MGALGRQPLRQDCDIFRSQMPFLQGFAQEGHELIVAYTPAQLVPVQESVCVHDIGSSPLWVAPLKVYRGRHPSGEGSSYRLGSE